MSDERPNPDALLSRLKADETAAARGRLEVFLGMCPGVGKTYAMLEAAQEDRREGKSVLVGVVETHGRSETAALLDGLSVLQRRRAEHRGITLEEFDLDAAIAAKPQLLLVDELAHTNAIGSRHERRWQDVRELIEAGISVKTTVNIQHVESLNDVVAQITGVRMKETVPDSILEMADEVMLVDLPADELLERLSAGKVYLGDQAQRAAVGFFKPANLTALRELALRFVAHRVGAQVRYYREAAGSQAIWHTQERVLVGVGPAPSSATLVRAAKRLAAMLGAEWFAVFVETPRELTGESRERVSEHLRLAESLGAKTSTVSGPSIPESILRFARRENVTKLVVGKPAHSRWQELLRPSPVDFLVRQSGDIDVYVIRGNSDSGARAAGMFSDGGRPSNPAVQYALPLAACALAVGFGAGFSALANLTDADVAMIFLLAAACVAFAGSRRASIIMAVLSVLAFNFFFVPPLYTFRISAPQFLITFAMLFIISMGISELTIRLRRGRDLARRSEERTEALYRISARLAQARGVDALALAASEELSIILGAPAFVTASATDGSLAANSAIPEKERAVAHWSYEHNRTAGKNTGTLESSDFTHIPLAGTRGAVGILSIRGADLAPAQLELVQALARHVALALSVQSLDEQRRSAAQDAESERLRSAVLSSVSHDLRTPLASILGSASGLLEGAEGLPDEIRRDLLANIVDESERLNRLISNVLQMTRLQGGAMRLQKTVLPVDEIVGESLRATRRIMRDHPVSTQIAADLPFVDADEILIAQVLINLLENAAKHTPSGTPVEISAAEDGAGWIAIAVADRGPGLPDVPAAQLFERFVQGGGTATGAGLGLAIARAIVVTHGGEITAENREGGGAVFRFTLPVASVPAMPHDEEQ